MSALNFPVRRARGLPTSLPSWMTAAVGEWAQISGTTAPSALKDYSGVALRDDGTGVTLYSAAPGGHSGNFTDNKVQAIQLNTASPAWSTILAASDTTGTNLGTGGGGSGGDEVMASDGHPTPRHTYTDINWIPAISRVLIGGEAGGQNSEVSTVDHFGFNPATNDWDAQGTWPDRPSFAAQAFAFNPATGERYAFYNTGTPNRAYKFDPTQTPPTWTLWTLSGGSVSTDQRGPWAFDTSRTRLYRLGGGWFTQSATLTSYQVNPSTGARTDITFNSSSAWTEFQANVEKFVGSSMVYSADDDCFYWYNGNTGTPALTGQGVKVYKITPNGTTTWDMSIVSVTGVTPADESNQSGAYNKFMYISRWRCVILVVGNQSVYYMRVA